MFANLSPNSPHNLNKTSNGYNAVVDFLSQFKVGSDLKEDDFSGLNQNVSSIRSSLNRLVQDGFLVKLQLISCDDCSIPVDEELICQECGKNMALSSLPAKETIFKVLKSIDRSADALWAIDNAFFNTKIYGHYTDGSTQEFWARIYSGEVLLPASAKINNYCPIVFKNNDDIYQINSDEIFSPLHSNRIRHYHYSITHKENKIVQNNNVTNYGTINSLNQSNQSNNTQPNAMTEVISLLDLILKNMDSSAATYAQNRDQIEAAKNDQNIFTNLNAILVFLSSVVTVAGFDLAKTIDNIKQLISN